MNEPALHFVFTPEIERLVELVMERGASLLLRNAVVLHLTQQKRRASATRACPILCFSRARPASFSTRVLRATHRRAQT
jgi:hypothetical protein